MVDKDRVAEPPPAHLNILTKQSRRQLSTIERLQEAHLRLGHPSFDSLVYMSKKGLLNNLPPLTHEIPIVCKACFHHNRTRVPKKPPDHSRPPIMARISCDFTFYSTLSLRGHNSAFTLVDQATRYPFAFPCCAKRPPISIIKFFIGCIRNMGFNPVVFRMDEGGELCKSSEFCNSLVDLNVIVHSTGGDNKTSNGLVERFHRTLHHMNRATLATMKSFLPSPLPQAITLQSFWDLCLCYVVQLKRILVNKTVGDSPYFLVHKRRPSYGDYYAFGSPCKMVTPQSDKLITTSRSGFFVGKGNNTGAFLVWCPSNPTKCFVLTTFGSMTLAVGTSLTVFSPVTNLLIHVWIRLKLIYAPCLLLFHQTMLFPMTSPFHPSWLEDHR